MKVIKLLLKLLPTQTVYAHCDIPCGIYDPYSAQVAAHTIVRMTSLIDESKDDLHKVTRMVVVKEKHALKVEEELVTLLADYFKDEHFQEYPELKELILKAIKMTGKVRQELSLEVANELLTSVQQIAEIFWKTRGLEPKRVSSGYPTGGEIVTHL